MNELMALTKQIGDQGQMGEMNLIDCILKTKTETETTV